MVVVGHAGHEFRPAWFPDTSGVGSQMQLFEILGFKWNRSAIAPGKCGQIQSALFRYRESLAAFVYDACALEDNPMTYPEVQALLEGKTVGGHSPFDQQQACNLGAAAWELSVLIEASRFRMVKDVSDRLHSLVAIGEALDPGHFRGEGDPLNATMHPSVNLGEDGRHWPLPTVQGAAELNRVHSEGVALLESEVADARERGMAYFLFGALQQFYFDGNKRTARFMMNGVLMAEGVDAITVPAVRRQDFDEEMVRFYVGKDGTEMMRFLIECQQERAQ